jgi:hypothetical protein
VSVARTVLDLQETWRFPETTGPRAGLLGNASLLPVASPTRVAGPLGANSYGVHFAAASQQALYVPDTHTGHVRGGEGFTRAFWVKFDTLTGSVSLMKRGDLVSEWQVYANNASGGTVGLAVWNSAGTAFFAEATGVSTGAWHHVAAVYDRAHVLLYLDGVLHTGDALTADVRRSLTNLQVGRILDGSLAPSQWLDGAIAELILVPRALTQAEITALQTDRPFTRGRRAGLAPIAATTSTRVGTGADGVAVIVQEVRSGPGLQRYRRISSELVSDQPSAVSSQVSLDDGRHYGAVTQEPDSSVTYPGGSVQELFAVGRLYHAPSGLFLRLLQQFWVGDGHSYSHVFLQGSTDYGATWTGLGTAPYYRQQVDYEAGAPWDPNSMVLNPPWRDFNEAYPGVNLWPAADGSIFTGLGNVRDPATGLIFGSWDGASSLGACVLRLRWNSGTRAFDVTVSNLVSIAQNQSTYGLAEASVATLHTNGVEDGRVLALWRNDNTEFPQTAPAAIYYTLSANVGATFTQPAVWTLDTGAALLAPAASPFLWRSSATGKLYWIGNNSPTAGGPRPRNPLWAAEIDETLLVPRPKRGTLTVLRDELAQLSNLTMLEESDGRTLEIDLTTYDAYPNLGGDAWHHVSRFTAAPAGLSVPNAAADYGLLARDGLTWDAANRALVAYDASRREDFAIGLTPSGAVALADLPAVGPGAFTLTPYTITAGKLSPQAGDTALAPVAVAVTAPDPPKGSATSADAPTGLASVR